MDNNNISVCAFNFAWVNDDDIKIHDISLNEGFVSARQYLLTTYTYAAACVFKNVLDKEKINLIESTGYFDDQNITIVQLNYGNMYYVPKVVLAYRQTGVSMWTSMTQYEKHLIDAFEYDILIKYAHKYKNEIFQRRFFSLKFVWMNRDMIYKDLGVEKVNLYVSLSKDIDGIFYRIIDFDKLSKSEKSIVNFFLKETILCRFIVSLQSMLNFIKKIIKFILPYGIIRLSKLVK